MNIIDRITKFRLTCDVGTRHFHNGHEYVEIGGVKWATMNIGANSVTDYGLFFQWGDTQGYTAGQVGNGEGKNFFYWSDYKYWDSTNRIIIKYDATDAKTVLDASDDAVSAAWGGGWRMPTKEEFQALRDAVNAVWTNNYQGSGINGLVCVDKTDSSKVLFFPAASYAGGGSVNDVGYRGFYWSSSLYSGYVIGAHSLYFSSSGVYWGSFDYRFYGCPVRGIVSN